MNAGPNAKLPRTEEGLQAVLQTLADARAAGDQASEGQALLDLAFLVKWVRSDNEEPPFERAHTLALEALELFRRIGDKRGQISALLLAVPMEQRESAEKMLQEAEELAGELGNDADLARVLLARSRSRALADKDSAMQLTRRALDLFQRAGHAAGMANCFFTLSISGGNTAEKRAYALEAERLFRETGELDEAGKAVMIAFWNSESSEELLALEPGIIQALADAQAAQNRTMEAGYYGALAKIAEAKGEPQEAEKYLRWGAELRESDGLTRTERRQQKVEMAQMMVAMAKRAGNAEAFTTFKEELRRLNEDDA